MDFDKLIAQRRSIRKFTEEQLSDDELRLLMRAALMAPSSKGTHSYEFFVVQDADKLQALSTAKDRGAELISGTPTAIVVGARPEVSDVWIEDASVASTILLLQAEDMGLGACWVQIRERQDIEGKDAEQNVRDILSLPTDIRIVSIVAVGHKGMERKPQNEEKLLWDKVQKV